MPSRKRHFRDKLERFLKKSIRFTWKTYNNIRCDCQFWQVLNNTFDECAIPRDSNWTRHTFQDSIAAALQWKMQMRAKARIFKRCE